MGNPDLELQNPDWDPHRRRRGAAKPRRFVTRLCVAVLAASMLLILAVCGLFGGAAAPSMLPQMLRPRPCPGHVAAHGGTPGASSKDASSYRTGGVAVADIRADVYLQRRNALAEVLKAEGVEAFVAEPGPIFEYYANISRADWEAFAPSQRPLLMVVQPIEHPSSFHGTGGAVVVAAKMALLAPRAQADRVRALLRLTVREPGGAELVTWRSRWNPYRVLRKSRLFAPVDIRRAAGDQRPIIMAGPETRAVVIDGLGDAGFRYRRLTPAVARLLPPW